MYYYISLCNITALLGAWICFKCCENWDATQIFHEFMENLMQCFANS